MSEVLKKKLGTFAETVKEGLEEVSRTDIGKKIKDRMEEAESVSKSGGKLGKNGAFRAISQGMESVKKEIDDLNQSGPPRDYGRGATFHPRLKKMRTRSSRLMSTSCQSATYSAAYHLHTTAGLLLKISRVGPGQSLDGRPDAAGSRVGGPVGGTLSPSLKDIPNPEVCYWGHCCVRCRLLDGTLNGCPDSHPPPLPCNYSPGRCCK